MRAFRKALLTLCAGLFFAALVPGVRADEWNKKTIITFNEAVEIPGQVLPPGTYVFKLYDSMADRHIVQVWSRDERKLFATVLAIPDYRLQPADQPVLNFDERPGSSPEALRAWFYPGDNYGQEFVYPQRRATELAAVTNTSVPAMPDDVAANTTTASSAGETVPKELAETSVATAMPPDTQQPSTQPSNTDQDKTAQPQATSDKPAEPAKDKDELPKTASFTPLIGLIGMLSLGVAAGLRLLSRRAS